MFLSRILLALPTEAPEAPTGIVARLSSLHVLSIKGTLIEDTGVFSLSACGNLTSTEFIEGETKLSVGSTSIKVNEFIEGVTF